MSTMKDYEEPLRRRPQACVDNCERVFELKCPERWSAFEPTDEPGVRYCYACQKRVTWYSSAWQAWGAVVEDRNARVAYPPTLGKPKEESFADAYEDVVLMKVPNQSRVLAHPGGRRTKPPSRSEKLRSFLASEQDNEQRTPSFVRREKLRSFMP